MKWILKLLAYLTAAGTAYELYDVFDDIMDGTELYDKGLQEIQDEILKELEEIEDEIRFNVEEESEIAFLERLADDDPQGEDTSKALGRWPLVKKVITNKKNQSVKIKRPEKPATKKANAYKGKPEIKEAIQEKIPFRSIITRVCKQAYDVPLPQLRKKRGVELKDALKVKSEAVKELLGEGWELVADVDFEDFLVVKLRQLAASILFEFIDSLLEWESPLKSEVWYGSGYADPLFDGGAKLMRVGRVNPFFPSPHGAGSIGADLIIPERRKEPAEKKNIFAIVEIKFPGDKIKLAQIESYIELLKKAEIDKDADGNRKDGKGTSYGGRLSLFRYPEDASVANFRENSTSNSTSLKKKK